MKSLCKINEIESDVNVLTKTWTEHFKTLAKSVDDDGNGLRKLKEKIVNLNEKSKRNEDYTLDVEFTDEEVQLALSKLKKRKAARPDGLMAEHLQEAGWMIRV